MGQQKDYAEFVHKNCDRSSPETETFATKHVRVLLEDASKTPVNSNQNPGLPVWFDLVKFKKGQSYFYKNYYSLFFSKLCGLLTILSIPSICRVLVMTNQSAKPVTAFKRYVATITQMLLWYEGDLLEPTSSAHKSLMGVRARHRSASIRANQGGFGHISQLDMVLTQFGFMGYAMINPKGLGLTGTPDEVEGFVHFWKTVGYLMGIEDRFNLCRGTVSETATLCQRLVDQAFKPAFQTPTQDFNTMSRALINGMWAMVPFLDYTAFFAYTKRLAGIHPKDLDNNNTDNTIHNITTAADYYSWIILKLTIIVHGKLLNNPWSSWFLRPFLNFQMWLSVYLTQNIPFLAWAVYGRMEVESPMTYH